MRGRVWRQWAAAGAWLVAASGSLAGCRAAEPAIVGDAAAPRPLRLVPADREPQDGRAAPTPQRLLALVQEVAQHPRERTPRFELVRGLQATGRLEEATEAAEDWRRHDAYNLVVVRMLGDLWAERGEAARARRVYSAVTELLPDDPQAQRALATVLEQSGDLEGAYQRLLACLRLAPEDPRLVFEVADVAHRLGRTDEAKERLTALLTDQRAPDALRYPARQRLAQVWAAERREALEAADQVRARELTHAIDALGLPGGVGADFKVFLTWDTDRTDVDLWVVAPSGEKVFYGHKRGSEGEALYHDVTTGYGPETFTARRAARGAYLVQVNYFQGGSQHFPEARGEVQVVLNEGREHEERLSLPYRLFAPGQTVTVARIEVE